MKILLNNSTRKCRIMIGGTPAEILGRVNKLVCVNNNAHMFVTVWPGILEISAGRLTSASAGHEYPTINIKGKYEILKDQHGLAIGAMDIARYVNTEIQLKKGDSIFVYTDGVAVIRVTVHEDPRSAEITFIDKVKQYDPLAKEEPDVTLSAKERKKGGLGIFMVKNTMDNVSYEYKGGKNILTIKKNLNQPNQRKINGEGRTIWLWKKPYETSLN